MHLCADFAQESLIIDLKRKFPKNAVNTALLFGLFEALAWGNIGNLCSLRKMKVKR